MLIKKYDEVALGSLGATATFGVEDSDYFAVNVRGNSAGCYLSGSGLVLDGTSGGSNGASIPDSTFNSVTGNLETVMRLSMPDWTPGNQKYPLSKRGAVGQRSWYWAWNTDGTLQLVWSPDGTNESNSTSNAFNFVDGQTYWLKITLQVSNAEVKFYWANDSVNEPTTWTLNRTVTNGYSTSVFDSTANVVVGHYGTGGDTNGTVYRAIVRNGFGGPAVADFDFTTAEAHASSITGGFDMGVKNGGLQLRGYFGHRAQTADSAQNSITGDIDVRWKVAATDWTPGSSFDFGGKWVGSTQRSWFLTITTTGLLEWYWSADGSTANFVTANAATGIPDGETRWIRVTHDVDNGASGNTVNFYSSVDGVAWTQIGSSRVTAGVTSIFDSSSQVEVGARNVGSTTFTGTIYRMQVFNGINGVKVFDANFENQPNNIVTFNGDSDMGIKQYVPTSRRNLVFNPSFETDTTGWFSNGGSTLTRVTTDSYSGSACLQITQAAGQFSGAVANIMPALPSTQYTLSGYIKIPSGEPTANLCILIHDLNTSGTILAQPASTLTNYSSATGWTRISHTFTTSATTTSLRLHFINNTTTPLPTVGQKILLDAVMLEQSSSVGTYYENSSTDFDTVNKTGGLQLRGYSGQYATVPDSPALSVTGDIDIKVKATLESWTPSTTTFFVNKDDVSTNRSYAFRVTSAGLLRIDWSSTGSNSFGLESSVATGFAANTTKWVRVTLDVNNGASGYSAKFYTSDDGVVWTQLGITMITGPATSIYDGNAQLEFGGRSAAGNAVYSFRGTLHRAIIQSAFDTTDNTTGLVLDSDFSKQATNALAFVEDSSSAALVTVNVAQPVVTIPIDQPVITITTTKYTWTGGLSFEATNDEVTWYPIALQNSTSTAGTKAVSTVSSVVFWTGATQGRTKIRVRMSAYTSGAVVAYLAKSRIQK